MRDETLLLHRITLPKLTDESSFAAIRPFFV
jgi:hypothetical protein